MLLTGSLYAQTTVHTLKDGVSFKVDNIKQVGQIYQFTGILETPTYKMTTDFITNCQQAKQLRDVFETETVTMTVVHKFPLYKEVLEKSPMESAINYVCKQVPKTRVPSIVPPISRYVPKLPRPVGRKADLLV